MRKYILIVLSVICSLAFGQPVAKVNKAFLISNSYGNSFNNYPAKLDEFKDILVREGFDVQVFKEASEQQFLSIKSKLQSAEEGDFILVYLGGYGGSLNGKDVYRTSDGKNLDLQSYIVTPLVDEMQSITSTRVVPILIFDLMYRNPHYPEAMTGLSTAGIPTLYSNQLRSNSNGNSSVLLPELVKQIGKDYGEINYQTWLQRVRDAVKTNDNQKRPHLEQINYQLLPKNLLFNKGRRNPDTETPPPPPSMNFWDRLVDNNKNHPELWVVEGGTAFTILGGIVYGAIKLNKPKELPNPPGPPN